MTTYRIAAPDGKTYKIDGPAGATQDEIQNEVIRQNPHLSAAPESGIPTGRGAAQIPVEPGANITPTQAPPSSFLGELRGAVETIPALVSGAVSGVVAPAIGLAGSVLQGKGPAEGERISRQVSQAMTYQPRTPEAQRNVQAVGNALAPLIGVPIPTMNMLAQSAPAALRAVGDVGRAEGSLIKGAVTAPLEARAATQQAQRVAQSYAAAPTIEATQAAQRIGAAVNPAVSNPTLANRAKGAMAGPAIVEKRLAKNNAVAVTDKVREDIGAGLTEKLMPEMDETTGKLNTNSPITRALNKAGEAYDPIRKMAFLEVPTTSIDALKLLRKEATIGGDVKAAAVNSLVQNALDKLQKTTAGPYSGVGAPPTPVGRSGTLILEDIRQLRRDAQAAYRAQKLNPDPSVVAKADTQMAIANILDDVIDANATSPKVLGDLKAARTRIAQIYEHENAFDYGLQKADPQAYAKMYQDRKGAMTGVGADIAKAASVFPNYFTLTPAVEGVIPRLSRAGFLGATGAAIGALGGPVTAAAGLAAGTGAGAIAGGLAAKRFASPAYQAAHAVPKDYRPAPSGLRPVEPNVPTNALVPYDYSQAAYVPPNFVMQGNQYAPRVTPVMPEATNMLGYGGTMESLAAEKARAAQMSGTLGRQAEAQQAAAASLGRQPTGRGQILELDPVTGKVTIGAEGGKGLTPNIQVIESTGKNLSGAADIIASGKSPALMTPEQRIAWNKTKVDLAEVVPGMKALNDKAIAAKMLDREWVQDAVTKARQKAKAFEDIAARAGDERARQAAIANRERMLDMAESLEDQLSAPRPVQGTSQGPKTRAAIRNKLAPEQTVQNALTK